MQKLKSQVDTKHIPIIMISAAPNLEKSVEEAQADNYLSKPFELEELFATVKKYIGSAE